MIAGTVKNKIKTTEWEKERWIWKRTSRSGSMASDEIRAAFFMAMPDVARRKKGIMKWMRGSGMVFQMHYDTKLKNPFPTYVCRLCLRYAW